MYRAMVPLPAAPVVDDGLSDLGVAHVGEAGRDVADLRVTVDLIESTVGPASQRRGIGSRRHDPDHGARNDGCEAQAHWGAGSRPPAFRHIRIL